MWVVSRVVVLLAAGCTSAHVGSVPRTTTVGRGGQGAPATVGSAPDVIAMHRRLALMCAKAAARAGHGSAPPTTGAPTADRAAGASTLVGIGPGCSSGYVDAKALAGSDDPQLLQVHRGSLRGPVIGYWSIGIGWLTPAQVRAPTFDFAGLVAQARRTGGWLDGSDSQPGG